MTADYPWHLPTPESPVEPLTEVPGTQEHPVEALGPYARTAAGGKVFPGDVLITRGKRSCAQRIIRAGTDSAWDHVAILHGRDTQGRWRVIEGKPGGVGWGDATKYLADPWTLDNGGQPKSDEQRARILAVTEELLKVKYDWSGILGDAVDEATMHEFDNSLGEIWEMKYGPNETPPGHFVCSSAAAYVYAVCLLAAPNRGELTTPKDWAEFITVNKYTWAMAS